MHTLNGILFRVHLGDALYGSIAGKKKFADHAKSKETNTKKPPLNVNFQKIVWIYFPIKNFTDHCISIKFIYIVFAEC